MINVIDHNDVVDVEYGFKSGVEPGTNALRLSMRQIEGFINGATNVDNRTMGWGMTFLHELHHTQVGGGLSDGEPLGDVVRQMNIIRSELNLQGGNYGQRESYKSIRIDSDEYIPFNYVARNTLRDGVIPIGGGYIKFKY